MTRLKHRKVRMSQKDKLRRRGVLLLRQKHRCNWCKAPFNDESPPTFDHLVPRRAGGTDALDNLVLACASCNIGRSSVKLGRRRELRDGVVVSDREGNQRLVRSVSAEDTPEARTEK